MQRGGVLRPPDLHQIVEIHDSTLSVDRSKLHDDGTHDTIPVAFRSANRLKFTPDGKYAFISDLGGTEVIVMDAATGKEIKRVNVGGGAAGIQMSADGARAFAAVGSRNGVAIIDVKTLQVSGFIATGPNPDGLAWVVGR